MDDEITAFLDADDAEIAWFLVATAADATAVAPAEPSARKLWFDGITRYGRAWVEREYVLRMQRRARRLERRELEPPRGDGGEP